MAVMSMSLRPNMSPNFPAIGMVAVEVKRYAVVTQAKTKSPAIPHDPGHGRVDDGLVERLEQDTQHDARKARASFLLSETIGCFMFL